MKPKQDSEKNSTIDNIFCLNALGQKYLSKPKGRFYCLVIDFAKAFDSVDHDKLWDYFTCNVGIRQGYKCSPLFFSLFINDIVSYLRQECGHSIDVC